MHYYFLYFFCIFFLSMYSLLTNPRLVISFYYPPYILFILFLSSCTMVQFNSQIEMFLRKILLVTYNFILFYFIYNLQNSTTMTVAAKVAVRLTKWLLPADSTASAELSAALIVVLVKPGVQRLVGSVAHFFFSLS